MTAEVSDKFSDSPGMLYQAGAVQNLLQELERRDYAQSSLAHYAKYMLGVAPALHHLVICNAIDRLLADDYDELIILAPPGSAKSHYTSIALPSYFVGKYPSQQVLTASYSTELAERWGRRVRNIVGSAKFKALFNVSLSKDSQSAGRWATDRHGEFYAAGVGSGILGFRADLAVIDDPISGFEQAQSLTQLAKVHDWYETDFATRLKPGAKTVLICQRLARNDLAGYLIDRNLLNPTKRQRVLKLRMEAEDDDPLFRQPGERLWPEWYTPGMVADAKRDDFKWRTLYQQEPPSDTGAWVSSDEIKIIDHVPEHLNHYLCSDLALSVNTGDFSVHLVVGVSIEGDVYLLDAWRERVAIDQTVEVHLNYAQTYDLFESLIDDDNASKVYVHLLASRARERGIRVPWKALPIRGQDKETRAAPLRGLFKRGKVFLKRGEWNRWFINELLQFPNAMGEGVDDGVDAFSLIGRRLAMLSKPSTELLAVKPPPPTYKDMTLNDMWEDHSLKRTVRRV